MLREENEESEVAAMGQKGVEQDLITALCGFVVGRPGECDQCVVPEAIDFHARDEVLGKERERVKVVIIHDP